jgi:hypothetical protein
MPEERASLIQSVRTPAGLLALGFLVVEGILATLAFKATGQDFTILVSGMLGLFGLLVVVFAILATSRPELFRPPRVVPQRLAEPAQPPAMKFDVFLSAPMAATNSENEYKESRDRALTIIQALKTQCTFSSVYFAGEQIKTKADFDPPLLAIVDDFEKIRQSRYFVLLYPEKVASSALVETGFALALGKTTVMFVHRHDDLPFLLKNADALPSVRIYDFADDKSLQKLIAKNRTKLFSI